ncbi:MAG: GvpL/GvpF family gas vesicle protein [Thermoleophilia bacterium]|nr:GvpL/GvpF family gas vesicle protein [Thermoleophilia bacterium]
MAATDSAAQQRIAAGSIYVYGLTWSGRGDARGPGVADAEVKVLEHGELAAIVSGAGGGPLRAKRRDLLRHSEVLQAAYTKAPVLPFRFGTVLDSAAAVDELLAERYEELVALLQAFEGLGELRLRASFLEHAILAEIVQGDPRIAALRDATSTATGADPRRVELGEAVARTLAAKRAAAADEIVASLVGHALELQVEEPREELEVVRASFLVERRRLRKFEAAADTLATGHGGRISFDLIGPMPPHSFVSLTPGGGA